MSFTTDFKSALASTTARAVYPLAIPQGVALPALTYQIISTTRDQTHSGASGLVTSRVQIDVFANTYADVEAIGDLVAAWLKNGRPTIGPVSVQHSRLSNEFDEYDSVTGEYRRIIDALITYQEA